jgi:hypothetical protein
MPCVSASPPERRVLQPRERWISLAEVVFGSFVVIGHNVLRIIPNEVPILFVLFWLSSWLRRRREDLNQFKRPKSWPKTILVAAAAALVLQGGSEFFDRAAHTPPLGTTGAGFIFAQGARY